MGADTFDGSAAQWSGAFAYPVSDGERTGWVVAHRSVLVEGCGPRGCDGVQVKVRLLGVDVCATHQASAIVPLFEALDEKEVSGDLDGFVDDTDDIVARCSATPDAG